MIQVGKRTIGILTKIDLMNINTDITNYLKNDSKYISKDLILNYGYFAVNCQSCDHKIENDYFTIIIFIQSLEINQELSIKNLTEKISIILLSKLYNLLPIIDDKINKKLQYINDKYGDISCLQQNNVTHLHYLINLFVERF